MKGLWVLLFTLLLFGCDTGVDQRQLEEVADSAKKAFNEAVHQIEDLAPSSNQIKSMTSDELAKLFAYEYKVLEVSKDVSRGDFEKQLQSLGRERWECFQIINSGDSLRVVCRRRPETYLRYIPRAFP